MPIDHAKLPVSDIDSARDFYAAALAPIGWGLVTEEALTVLHFGTGDAFHAAALAAGGTDNGPPAERPYGPRYSAAFVLDPDGHNLEVVYKGPQQERPEGGAPDR
jgi:catechol 2,3-dioxygenase-like lactoylglutathione lyase family enzyme